LGIPQAKPVRLWGMFAEWRRPVDAPHRRALISALPARSSRLVSERRDELPPLVRDGRMPVRPPRAPDRQLADRLLVSRAVHPHAPGWYDDEPALGNALLLPAGEGDQARAADKSRGTGRMGACAGAPGIQHRRRPPETQGHRLWPPRRTSASVPGRSSSRARAGDRPSISSIRKTPSTPPANPGPQAARALRDARTCLQIRDFGTRTEAYASHTAEEPCNPMFQIGGRSDLERGAHVHLHARGVGVLDRGKAFVDGLFERELAADDLIRDEDAVREQPECGGEILVPHV